MGRGQSCQQPRWGTVDVPRANGDPFLLTGGRRPGGGDLSRLAPFATARLEIEVQPHGKQQLRDLVRFSGARETVGARLRRAPCCAVPSRLAEPGAARRSRAVAPE